MFTKLSLNTASASSAVNSSTFAEIFIEQNFGPHMEQKCASLKPSSGSVSSCMEEVRVLEAFLRQRFIVHGAGRLGIERQLELAVPVEAVARARQLVVAVACAGAVARDVGGVRGDLVSDDAGLHIVAIGQAQVLLGRDVAQH